MGILDGLSKFVSSRPEGSVESVSASEALDMLMLNSDVVLLDVRTKEEWKFVGIPLVQFGENRVHFVSWRILPDMQQNGNFLQDVRSRITDLNVPIILMCRSGARSMEAGVYLMRNGYTRCYNIEYGFEGELDMNYQRGFINGWKASALPWGRT